MRIPISKSPGCIVCQNEAIFSASFIRIYPSKGAWNRHQIKGGGPHPDAMIRICKGHGSLLDQNSSESIQARTHGTGTKSKAVIHTQTPCSAIAKVTEAAQVQVLTWGGFRGTNIGGSGPGTASLGDLGDSAGRGLPSSYTCGFVAARRQI